MENHQETETQSDKASYVGTYAKGRLPRKETWKSEAVYWITSIPLTFVALDTWFKIHPWLQENIDNYKSSEKLRTEEASKSSSFFKEIKNDISELLSRKLWKSTAVSVATGLALVTAGEVVSFFKRKTEEATFRKENPDWDDKQLVMEKLFEKMKEKKHLPCLFPTFHIQERFKILQSNLKR